MTHLKKYSYNILGFICISTILFISLYSASVHAQPDETNISILEKLSEARITMVMDDAETIEELAEIVGITVDELEHVCQLLDISLDRYRPVVPSITELLSYKMLSSDQYDPDVILEYNDGSPYLLLVEKSTHTLFLLKYENGNRTLVAAYGCKTGKQEGDKQQEGDEKTPEGIFYFNAHFSRKTIESMVGKANAYQYGEMAFVTDYPNPLDRLKKKNGSGIWLHGTDEPFFETSSLDTRGCVVTTNETITELQQYITLNRTPIVIVETLSFVSKEELARKRNEYLSMLYNWRDAWLQQDINRYMEHYHLEFSQSGRNVSQWREYKNRIFNAYAIDTIDLSHIVILRYNDGLIIQFDQDYEASNLSSHNVKVLYLTSSGSSWGIIAETLLR